MGKLKPLFILILFIIGVLAFRTNRAQLQDESVRESGKLVTAESQQDGLQEIKVSRSTITSVEPLTPPKAGPRNEGSLGIVPAKNTTAEGAPNVGRVILREAKDHPWLNDKKTTPLGKSFVSVDLSVEEFQELHPKMGLPPERERYLKNRGQTLKKIFGKNGEIEIHFKQTKITCPQDFDLTIPTIFNVDVQGRILEAAPISDRFGGSLPQSIYECRFDVHEENGVPSPFITKYFPMP